MQAEHRTERSAPNNVLSTAPKNQGNPLYMYPIEAGRTAQELSTSASQLYRPTRTSNMYIFFARARVNEYDIYSIVC